MAPKVKVVVSVDDDHVDKMSEVVKACRAAGLSVERSLESLGTITGSIDSTKLGKLNRVEGISSVEQSADYQLPSPGDDVQ
ncbi:MAG: hypothetical protein WD278_11140 [Pirellulales bacterium]